jgi:hypothetical protein
MLEILWWLKHDDNETNPVNSLDDLCNLLYVAWIPIKSNSYQSYSQKVEKNPTQQSQLNELGPNIDSKVSTR